VLLSHDDCNKRETEIRSIIIGWEKGGRWREGGYSSHGLLVYVAVMSHRRIHVWDNSDLIA
jgi:hypothetical protein